MPEAPSPPLNLRMTPTWHDIRKSQNHLLGRAIKDNDHVSERYLAFPVPATKALFQRPHEQGRVILDSDWNESERIDDEEARRTLAETVCANGTPNEGFLVRDVTEATVTVPPAPSRETYDFTLGSGSFYLAGLRVEVVTQIVAEGPRPRAVFKPDRWLQIDADLGNLPARPSVADLTNADHSRFAMTLCTCAAGNRASRPWRTASCASGRWVGRIPRSACVGCAGSRCCPMWTWTSRVGIFARRPSQGSGATRSTRQGDGTGEPHPFDDANCELRSKAKLTLSFGAAGITEDPSSPR